MRLKRGQQVGLIIVGLAVFTLGVTASAREWPAAGIISLILPGLLMTVFGVVGVFPNVHLKEGNVEGPKIEVPNRLPLLLTRRPTRHNLPKSTSDHAVLVLVTVEDPAAQLRVNLGVCLL